MDKKIYVYGFVPANEVQNQPIPEHEGFDESENLYSINMGTVTALVADLEPEAYTEEIVEEKMNNDLEWLQKKAFHHHEILMELNKLYTVIPLSFCTIYNNQNSLVQSVTPELNGLFESFERINGKEEWNLKIYCNDDKLKETVNERNPVINEKRAEIRKLSPGRQFFEKKKIEQLVNKELEKERDKLCEQIHNEFKLMAAQADVKKTLGKDVTGRKERMGWNSVYLVAVSDVNLFLEKIERKEQEMQYSGIQIEITGPWPSYHFVSLTTMEK
ncbi:GvpL/GvpF family gas vesicle protein [Virgibacillus ihumii]|uniref:GvpL/GvpF family gas vesicle protein n=1 Tax=Virgibacillus ihumii TaxID=2686091 RepID=UPI00157D60F9|nr:GvpL/GvpF family gas vesicle protein [Virgibacillus ihumii]